MLIIFHMDTNFIIATAIGFIALPKERLEIIALKDAIDELKGKRRRYIKGYLGSVFGIVSCGACVIEAFEYGLISGKLGFVCSASVLIFGWYGLKNEEKRFEVNKDISRVEKAQGLQLKLDL